jgi:hypothetical protein
MDVNVNEIRRTDQALVRRALRDTEAQAIGDVNCFVILKNDNVRVYIRKDLGIDSLMITTLPQIYYIYEKIKRILKIIAHIFWDWIELA